MAIESCDQARTELSQAMHHVLTNNGILAGASPALAVAVAGRMPLSMPDIAGMEQSIAALEQELESRRSGDDFVGGEAQVQRMRAALAQARETAKEIGRLDKEIAELEAKVKEAQHQIEVQTERVNAAEAYIAEHCR